MLVLTRAAEDLESAKNMCRTKLRDGSALEKFQQNIKLQIGDPRICDEPDLLLNSAEHELQPRRLPLLQVPIISAQTGFVAGIDTLAIGSSICAIGGGRVKVDDTIDYQVGYQCERKIGDAVRAGEPLGVLFCRGEVQATLIGDNLQRAYRIAEEKTEKLSLIKQIIS
jgi:thymidine phosphorylase